MCLKPGDIVTDQDQESLLLDQQGVVTDVQFHLWADPEVTVLFDRALYLMHLADDECERGVPAVYPPSLLRRNDDWQPEVYARRLFGNRWHSLYVMKAPLNPAESCMVARCSARQAQTIWFNIWGSVCNAYVCAEHAADYHGLCGDSFPWRQDLLA